METLTFYVARANEELLELTQDGETVNEDAVLRAVLRFGPYCLDTDEHPTLIELYDSAQKLRIKAGLIEGIKSGDYIGHLTLYDALTEDDGLKWQDFRVQVRPWNVCPIVVV